MNPSLVPDLEEKGMKFVGHDIEGERMEIMEVEGWSNLKRNPLGNVGWP